MSQTRARRACGFSLVELVAVLLILAVLALIAYPVYRRHLVHAHRVEAEAQLLEAAQWLERFYSAHDAYTDGDAAPSLPAALRQSPAAGTPVYRLGWAAAGSNPACPAPVDPDAGGYCLQATPVPDGLNRADGLLQLDAQGVQYWDANHDGSIAPTEDRWPS